MDSAEPPPGTGPAGHWYRRTLGWPVSDDGPYPLLPLTEGRVGFRLTRRHAAAAVRGLAAMDAPGPVLLLPGARPSAVFLADANDMVFAQEDMPPGVRFLRAPATLPLPAATPLEHHRWLVAPDPVHRWLPSAEAVRCMLGRVIAAAPDAAPAEEPDPVLPHYITGY